MAASDSHCIFCRIASGLHAETKLEFEDEHFVVFNDHRPASSLHLLVLPKAHYQGIRHLNAEHIPLIRNIEKLGIRMLEERGIGLEESLIGFHWPLTSVSHLHMHCIAPKSGIHNCFKKIEFSRFFFGSVDQAVAELQKKATKDE